jgi:putative molybdopterin biosynthesis protein
MKKRNIYLEDIPIEAAWTTWREALQTADRWQPLGQETIPVAEALGRVTAVPIWARLSSPHYHASAMDGFAIRAADSEGATETNPARLTLVEEWHKPAEVRPAYAVNTGQPLPPWANAVIMIEHTQAVTVDERPAIEIRAAAHPWHHVRAMGEDMVATELVLPANHRLRPVDLGAVAGSGHATVIVYRQPRVAIIPTGSELVSAETAASQPLQPGQIIEYNSIVLAAQVAEWGGLPARLPSVPDEAEAIKTGVASAAARNYDLILLNAGSSAGSEDYTAHVVGELGQLLVHGVAVRPGHPVILGMIATENWAVPIVGVPGYPVSAALTGEIFIEPLLAQWQGQRPYQPPTLQATLTRKVASPTGDDDYLRVVVGTVGEQTIATPISRGAGVISSLVRADGIVRIPRFSEGFDAGTAVTVHLYRTPHEIARTLLITGSHDLTIDLLAQFMAGRGVGRISSANVGSLGGLMALRRGHCHVTGSHLLDPDTGVYNESYVRRYLPGQPVYLVTLVGREQGWIVPPGNPLGLQSWADAGRRGLSLVNRQRGAGTRVLFDYELIQSGLDSNQIQGYDREEYTHLAVAAAVASGTADAGLGIRAAARALELDFVPLAQERYDLVIPQAHYQDERVQGLLALLHEPAFREAVAALPGYDVTMMGQQRLIENPVIVNTQNKRDTGPK